MAFHKKYYKIRLENQQREQREAANEADESCPVPVVASNHIRSPSTSSTVTVPARNITYPTSFIATPHEKSEYESYNWRWLLRTDRDFRAADVSLFPHAPNASRWGNIEWIGMKVECPHRYFVEECDKNAVWYAKVVDIKGYMVLLQWEGFACETPGFWVNIASQTGIRNLGFYKDATIPPTIPGCSDNLTIHQRMEQIVDAWGPNIPTMSMTFQKRIRKGMEAQYKVGDLLEVLDKDKLSQMRVARVIMTLGQRILMKYHDARNTHHGRFWFHQNSPSIHPLGWSKAIGHKLSAPKGYKPPRYFPSQIEEAHADFEKRLKIGMKLEMVDPLNLSEICAATIKKVLKYGYFMAAVDHYETDSDPEVRWFCHHITSPNIFRCNFCWWHGIPLTPPHDHQEGLFKWDEYFLRTGTCPAPIPEMRSRFPRFEVGQRLEAVDMMLPWPIYTCRVVQVVAHLIRISTDGWSEEYDQWFEADSVNIYPVGWSEVVKLLLEPPKVCGI